MPVFVAFLKAELENVKYVAARTSEEAMFTLDVKNGQCGGGAEEMLANKSTRVRRTAA